MPKIYSCISSNYSKPPKILHTFSLPCLTFLGVFASDHITDDMIVFVVAKFAVRNDYLHLITLLPFTGLASQKCSLWNSNLVVPFWLYSLQSWLSSLANTGTPQQKTPAPNNTPFQQEERERDIAFNFLARLKMIGYLFLHQHAWCTSWKTLSSNQALQSVSLPVKNNNNSFT